LEDAEIAVIDGGEPMVADLDLLLTKYFGMSDVFLFVGKKAIMLELPKDSSAVKFFQSAVKRATKCGCFYYITPDGNTLQPQRDRRKVAQKLE